MLHKIRQLIADLEAAGFMLAPGGKGAQPYQEKQIRHAIRATTR